MLDRPDRDAASLGPASAAVAKTVVAERVTRTYFIKTYGCQMNVYDSARMADVLAPLGYAAAPSAEAADLVILNTCHIREKAAEKVYSELGRLGRLKRARARAGRPLLLAVAGCVAEAEGAEMRARAPSLDLVFGPQSYQLLPEMLERLAERGASNDGVVETEFPVEPKFDRLPEEQAVTGPSAFVTVQEGCDKFCSFCVVPYTRGAEYSRDVGAIEREVRQLVARGVVEVTLLGQNVNAYHGRGPGGAETGLARLLRRLARIDGLARLRYTTSHPLDLDEALIAVHGEEPKLMPYLHLPAQSGSDRVLAAMNRGYTAAEYLRLVEGLRRARPDLALSSDFIVGFPGESEADLEATLDLVRAVGFASAYSFAYSARPGTPAASQPGQLPRALVQERLARLQALLKAQQTEFNRACVGRVLPVLVDRPGRHPGQLAGRSPYLQAVHLPLAADRLGTIVPVRILNAQANSLAGTAVEAVAVGGIGAGAPAREAMR